MKRLLHAAWTLWLSAAVCEVRLHGQGAPAITSLSTFRAQFGQQVTINGRNFLNPRVSSVLFNNTPAPIESLLADRIVVRVPVGATIGPVIVENARGQAITGRNFQVPPTVSRFEKAGGLTDADRVRGIPGDTVLVFGSSFADDTDAGFRVGVFFDTAAATVISQSDGALTVRVPAGAASGPITVTNNAGSFVTTTNFFIPPVASGFTPRGRTGDRIAVAGRSLRSVATVIFGTVPSTDVAVESQTNLTVLVPAGAPASGPLTLESPGGRFVTTSNFVLAPRITGFTPTNGAPGTNVTIRGTGLAGITQVRFGGAVATPVSAAASQVVVVVPHGAGTARLVVSGPSGEDTSEQFFAVAPRITGISPARLRPGQTLVVSGTNFLGATAVLFGDARIPAASFVVQDNTSISAVVPAGAAGGRVRVTTPGGEAVSDAVLTVTGPEPGIVSFGPANGSAGTVVAISGTNLTPVVAVRFNGVVATAVAPTANGLAATVPAGASTGRISVETANGTAVSATDFVVGTTAALRVALAASANPAVVDSPLRLALEIRNAGPLAATATRAAFTLPPAAEYIDASAGAGTFARTADGVAFEVGTVSVGATWTGEVRVRFPAQGSGEFLFSATNAVPEADLSDNLRALVVTAIPLRLDVTAFGPDLLVVSWPAGVTNVALQETPLLSPTRWRAVGVAPVNDGVRIQVAIESTNAARLYRLRGP